MLDTSLISQRVYPEHLCKSRRNRGAEFLFENFFSVPSGVTTCGNGPHKQRRSVAVQQRGKVHLRAEKEGKGEKEKYRK